jgi:sulfur-oxidizing protein SoxY|tara:strand:+ start:1439 stop:1930 length:492 start_codon:yes stop_codon:yes gene_type:complete
MAKKTEPHIYHRRDFLTMAGTGVVAVAGIGLFPGDARADHGPGHIPSTQAFKAKFGDTPMKSGRITMDLPQIAEDGNTVPVGFEVESPMTESDYVKAVHIIAEKNPNPNVATYRFTPDSGRAKISTRVRLLKTQNVIAVAEMSDGSVYMTKTPVKVTIGGCGS